MKYFKVFERKFNRSLLFKIIIGFFLISEITAILIIFSTDQDYRKSLTKFLLAKADLARVKKSAELQDWLTENQGSAAAIAGKNDISKKLQNLLKNNLKDSIENSSRNGSKDVSQLDLATTFNYYLGNYPQVDSVVFVANDRILFHLDNKSASGNSPNSMSIDISDRANDNGKGYLNFQNDQPIITFANPIFDESGNRIGKLLVNSKLERFSKNIDNADIANIETDNDLFDNYLVGKFPDNRFFVIKNSLEIKNDATFIENIAINQGFADTKNTARYRSHTGVNVFGSYGKFKDLGIILLSEAAEKTALASGDRNIGNMFVIANGIVMIMTAICYLLIRYQMQLVVEVADVAAAIVKGDLDVKFPTGGKDEIGALAIALNHLLAKFKYIEQSYLTSDSSQGMSLDVHTHILNKYINITSEGFLILDQNGLILDINANFAEILSISITEAIGGSYIDILPTEISTLVHDLVKRSPNQLNHEQVQQIKFCPPYDQPYLINISTITNQENHQNNHQNLDQDQYELLAIIITAHIDDNATSLNLQNYSISPNQSLLISSKYREEITQKLRIPMTSLLGFLKVTQQKLESSILPKVIAADDKTKRSVQQVSQNLEVMISEGMLIAKAIGEVLQEHHQGRDAKSSSVSQVVSIAQLLKRFHSEALNLCHQKNCQLVFSDFVDNAMTQPSEHNISEDLLYVLHNLLYRLLLTANYGNIIFNARLINQRLVITIARVNLALSTGQVNLLMDKLYTAIAANKATRKNNQVAQGSGLTKIQNILEKYGGTTALEILESNRESHQFYVLTLPIDSK